MIEYRLNHSETNNGPQTIKVTINSSFTSEYVGTPMNFGRLEDGTEVVLKFTKMPEGAAREFNGLALANEYGVPSPKAIALIQRNEEPNEGFIMERVQGRPLNEVGTLDHEFQLGQAVRKLHEIRMPGYGPIVNDSSQFDTAEAYLNYWLGRTIPYMGEHGEAVQLMTELFAQGRDHILSRDPRLLHRDLKDENVYIKPDGDISIIDFEWAQGGNPFDDLGVNLYHALRTNKPQERIHAFLRGYFGERELTDLEKYNLLFHLVLSAGRTVSFCSRMNPSHLEEAKEDMEKVVQYARTILRNTPGYK